MAKEYIEREAVLQKLSRMIDYCKTDSKVNGLTALFQVGDAVMDCPAADVAPVVQGEWICVDTDDEQFFLCNRCKDKEYWESNYCPNCGAKMDGGEENAAD